MPTERVTFEVIHNHPSGELKFWRHDLARAFLDCQKLGIVVDRWIPVEERMPEEGDRVLFYNGNCKVGYARKPHIGVCIDDGSAGLQIVDLLLQQVTPNRDETWPDVTATHWMPLPEPPGANFWPESEP